MTNHLGYGTESVSVKKGTKCMMTNIRKRNLWIFKKIISYDFIDYIELLILGLNYKTSCFVKFSKISFWLTILKFCLLLIFAILFCLFRWIDFVLFSFWFTCFVWSNLLFILFVLFCFVRFFLSICLSTVDSRFNVFFSLTNF